MYVIVRVRNGYIILDFVSKDDYDLCFCEFYFEKECFFYCIICDVVICLVCVFIKYRLYDIFELVDKIKEFLKEIVKENN